jgi:hypothetical protein
MEKTISRTFKLYEVTITDAVTNEVLKSEVIDTKLTKEKIAIKFIKERGKTNFIVDIIETETLREMTVDFFIKNSTIVVPKVKPVDEFLAPTEKAPETQN